MRSAEQSPNVESSKGPQPTYRRIFDVQCGVQDATQSALGPASEMDALVEAGVMNAEPFNMHDLLNIVLHRPLRCSDLLNQTTGSQEALVLTEYDFENLLDYAELQEFSVIDKYGRKIRLVKGAMAPNTTLIIFPDDLGEEEGKPFLKVVDEAESD